ncbi:class I SAM-dependent methyltransferase [Roseimicrobium sp. ORNL1]|uniref:class I SAM-dependent methyltransferase n=1 Tax=Roseimicrobium sp. ORNL1 TaxID=2711231 RepID=UPI0013E142E8|nr:class I SAM-dependent methyltransferase [Roseimicrobium sp. ORNL1]QIF00675.1 methyltransferase [Roseimicrobium sp. ORNL1]
MLQIVRFNPWPYVASVSGIILGTVVLSTCMHAWPWWLQALGMLALGACGWLTVGSLLVSHLIYDRSDWPRGQWLQRALLQPNPEQMLNVHAGFDETTVRLRRWLPGAKITALDLFDPKVNTECSLLRARASLPTPPGTLVGSLDAWSVSSRSQDVVCLLLAAHEFRKSHERRRLLEQARSTLRISPSACIVLAEHARDAANFLAFGPGFLHFHSPATWQRDWEAAGLQSVRAFRVTPFLRVWILQPASTQS